MTNRLSRAFAVPFVLALAAGGVAGCGSDDEDAGSSPPTAAETTASGAVAIPVPEEIRSKGTLVVATDPTHPPSEFVERGDVVGMDVDLAEAIGERLGLDVEIERAPVDAILPGLAAGRYDLGVSSFTDTRGRGRTVDFVTYFRAGTSFYKRSGTEGVRTVADLCGRSVAVARGTTQARDARAQGRRCRAAGEDPVDVRAHRGQSGADRAIRSGRAEIGMAATPVAGYAVRQSDGALEPTGEDYGVGAYGIAIRKDSGLQDPILDAVRALMQDGTYDTILREWGLEHGAIDDPRITGALG